MLAGLPPAALARLRFPLGELTKPEVREIAAARRPRRRRQGREPGPLLPRRRGQGRLPRPSRRPRRPRGRDRRRGRQRRSVAIRGHHRFTVGQRRGLGVAAPEPLYVLAHRRRYQPRRRRPARPSSTTRRVRDPRRDPAPASGPRRRGQAALPLAAARLPGRRPPRRPAAGRHDRLALELEAPARGPAPGQTAVLWTATSSSATARSPSRPAAGRRTLDRWRVRPIRHLRGRVA